MAKKDLQLDKYQCMTIIQLLQDRILEVEKSKKSLKKTPYTESNKAVLQRIYEHAIQDYLSLKSTFEDYNKDVNG